MGKGCKGCSPAREIVDLRFVNNRHWPEQWIRTAAPGDLLLLAGKIGACGGLLRLKKPATFLALGSGHIWRGHTLPWPFKGDGIRALRIRGNKLEYVLE